MNHEECSFWVLQVDDPNHPAALPATFNSELSAANVARPTMPRAANDRFDLTNGATMNRRMLGIPIDPSEFDVAIH